MSIDAISLSIIFVALLVFLGLVRAILHDMSIFKACLSTFIWGIGFLVGVGIGLITGCDTKFNVFLGAIGFFMTYQFIDPFVLASLTRQNRKQQL